MAPFSEVAFVFRGVVPIAVPSAQIALHIVVPCTRLPDGGECRAVPDGANIVGSVTSYRRQAPF